MVWMPSAVRVVEIPRSGVPPNPRLQPHRFALPRSPLSRKGQATRKTTLTAGLAVMIALSKEQTMSTRSSVLVVLICGLTALSLAQAPPQPPKPGPEHKKLEYFLGTWKV